jgi:predicted nucleic acid-binding protein
VTAQSRYAAIALYDGWHADPRVELALEPHGTEAAFRRAAAPSGNLCAAKAVADCYLVGFAEASGSHLVTLDKGLAHTARSRRIPVTQIRPVTQLK